MLLSLLLAAASPKLPPWTAAAPPQRTADAAVMAPVDALLAALAARDGAAMLAVVRADGSATAVAERADGSRRVTRSGWADFAARFKPGPERYQERLTDVAIEADDDVAMVWSPYVFTIDGKPDHCGMDHFDLIREAGAWKISNLTWSQRACDQPSASRSAR